MFVEQNASGLPEFFKLFVGTEEQDVRFWLLDAIATVIKKHYSVVNAETRTLTHQAFFAILRDHPDSVLSVNHLLKKYALIFVLLLKKDCPEGW